MQTLINNSLIVITLLILLVSILLTHAYTRAAVGTWRAMSAGVKSPVAPMSPAPEPKFILKLGQINSS